MHGHHDIFVRGIIETKKIELTFLSNESQANVVKRCVPVDFSPGKRARDTSELYYFWDFESGQSNYLLSLPPDAIIKMELIDEEFNPKDFVTFWKKVWYIKRDWGSACKVTVFLKRCFGLGKEPKSREDGDRRSSWMAK